MNGCKCEECKTQLHDSDCAVHNEPATPNGDCDCRNEWISVEDRLPEGRCLVFIPNDETQMHTAHYHENITIIGSHFEFDRKPVTHWQPLPPPPTK